MWPLRAQENPREIPPASDLTKLSLEELMNVEVVSTASKYLQKTTEAPSSVSIVTGAEIRQYGYRTLADILQSLRGFFVTSDRNYSYVGVRGFGRSGDYNARVLVLVDGHRINDNIYDGLLIEGGFQMDPDLIDRVEVVRGPSSSIYGNNAFFAVVNVITRKGSTLGGAEVSAEAASFDTYKGRVTYGKKLVNGPEFLLSGTFLDSKGQRLYFPEFDSPGTNNGVAEDADGERHQSLFGNVSYRGFTLQAAHVLREKGIPTASFGTVFNDPRTKTWDQRTYVSLEYDQPLFSALSIRARATWDRSYYWGDYVYDYPPVTVNRDFGFGEWWGAEAMLTYTGIPRNTLILGSDFQESLRQEQGNYDQDPHRDYFDIQSDIDRQGLFVQDEYRISSQVILNAGLRLDHHSTFGQKVSPRAALILNTDRRTSLKLLYGQAFRAPNAYELYYSDAKSSVESNPNLEPETVKTTELVAERLLGEHLKVTVSGFYYTIDGRIAYRVDPETGFSQYRNAEKIESKGVEAAASAQLPAGVTGRASWAYQQTSNAETGEELVNSPRHLLKLNMAVPLFEEKLSAGLEARYTTGRLTLAGNEAGGFFLANLTLLSRSLVRGLDVSASIYNALGRRYGDPGAEEHQQYVIQQDGRSFRLKATFRF
jgi:outer membrane receptor for ferrienterochelin and colicins